MVFNSSITIDHRQGVEGYLAWKWGLQDQLPVEHPYYSISPTTLKDWRYVLNLRGRSAVVNWTGPYDVETVYSLNDGIDFNGVAYVCVTLQNVAGVDPTTPGVWSQVGNTGSTGYTGDTGPIGDIGNTGDTGLRSSDKLDWYIRCWNNL